ncbi:MAG TPA: hypothetical protein VH678_05790 [Xanthobacteraceae bacterium]|jgi:phage terminase small subunit
MPVLKNPRHERFARLLASGKTAVDAHELAGYKRDDGHASRWARKPEIRARVQEIAGTAAERAAVTVDGLIAKAEAVLAAAMEAGQHSAAIAAIKEIGVLSGKRIERSERGQPGEFDWLDRLSVAELELLANGELDIESYRKGGDGSSRSRTH